MGYLGEMNYIAKTVFCDELHDYWDEDGEKLDLSKISDAIKDDEKLFDLILNILRQALYIAITPFAEQSGENKRKYIQTLNYDEVSLEVTTLYWMIEYLSDKFSTTVKKRVEERYDQVKYDNVQKDAIKKRIYMLDKMQKERNREHQKYFRVTETFAAIVKENDVRWYEFLDNNLYIKRFLYEEKTIKVNQKLLDAVEKAYTYIEENTGGYERFKLYYMLEWNSRLEFFSNMCNYLKKLKPNDIQLHGNLLKIASMQKFTLFNKYDRYHVEVAELLIKSAYNYKYQYIFNNFFQIITEINEEPDLRLQQGLTRPVFEMHNFYNTYKENSCKNILKLSHQMYKLYLIIDGAAHGVADFLWMILSQVYDSDTNRIKEKVSNFADSYKVTTYFDDYIDNSLYGSEKKCYKFLDINSRSFVAKCLNKIYYSEG